MKYKHASISFSEHTCRRKFIYFFFFNDTATTEIYTVYNTLSLHDALPISSRGYRVIVVVPEKFVGPKTEVMRVLGAEVILTPTEGGIQGAIAKAKEVAAALPDAFVPQQFENPANPAYHYRTTAAEIHAQLGRFPDALVLGAGTGGTFTGVARYFKEREPRVRAVLVEPQGSVWGGGPAGPHKVEG